MVAHHAVGQWVPILGTDFLLHWDLLDRLFGSLLKKCAACMAFLPKICQFHYQDLVLDNERITWITTDSSVRGWYKYTVLWSTNWRGNCRYLQPEDLNITMTPHRFPWGHDQIISTSASSSNVFVWVAMACQKCCTYSISGMERGCVICKGKKPCQKCCITTFLEKAPTMERTTFLRGSE